MIAIHLFSFIIFIFSASYIWTVNINEILIENKFYMRVFTYYNKFRFLFKLISIITWGLILYIAYYLYEISWLLNTSLLILFAYNISWLLRSIFKDLLYLEFYLLPIFIGLVIYNYFNPIPLYFPLSKGIYLFINIVIFLTQSYLDHLFLKKQIWIEITIDNGRSDFTNLDIQNKLISDINSKNPYYWSSQIKRAFLENTSTHS